MSSSTTTDAGCMTHPVNKKSTTRKCNCVHRYFYLLPRERVGAASRARRARVRVLLAEEGIPLRRQQQFLLNFDTENTHYKKHTPPLRIYIQVGSVPITVLSQLDGSWIKPEMTVFFWSETNQHVRFGSNFEKVQNNVEKITSSTLKIKYAAPVRSGPGLRWLTMHFLVRYLRDIQLCEF